jgi:hypothetical protein
VPGCIHLRDESVQDTLDRVMMGELGLSDSIPCIFLNWLQYPKGNGVGESPRGDVVSLVFVSDRAVDVAENATTRFFPLDRLPEDLLPIHVPLMGVLKKHYGLV